ncbi:MAG: Ig-like domain-containing protein, partial [Planctomycetota bacterium]|nr:Ig-like domain-containing protein [Planctomycetota bacterium]
MSVRVGNRAPIPIDDSYFAVAGELRVFSSPGVLGNDADPDGDPISAVLATAASHGTVSLNANGSFTYSAASGYSGSDSFTYRVNDGLATSNVATVRLTVYPTDNSVTNDEYSIPHDHPLTVGTASGVLINDWDLEGDSLSAQLVSGPAHGGLSFASNGAFVYTPSAGFAGVDSFQYRATDGTHVTNVGTVTLRVLNRSPDSSDDVFTFMHDTSLTVAVPGVLGGDADFDHDNLSAILLSNPQHGALAFNASGGFTYIPAAGFSGIDSFTYRATDGIDVSRTATVTLRVNRFAPVTSDDSIPISAGRTALLSAADLLSNDFDPEDDPLTVVIASDPVHGSVNLEADGRVRYVPNAGFRGSGTATVTLVVANESPIGVVDSYQMPPDRVFQSGENGLLVNDIDPERDPLIAELVVEPAHGIVEISRDGSFTYRPNPGFEGSDAFCYRVRDPYSNSGPTRVDLSVVNARPVAHDDVFHARPDSPLLVSAIQGILANDFDADSDSLTPELRRVPAHGLVTIDADGGFFYRSANGFSGRDEFTYRLSDGRIASDEAVVVLYVTNGSPTALDDSYSLPHDRPFYVSPANGLLSNDTDPDQDFLSVNLIAGVSHGLLRLDATGGFDYRPDPGFVGDDYFTYRAIDGAAASETVGVTLHVGNIVPTAQSSKYTVAHGQPIRVPAPGLLAGAFDPDDDSLSVTILTPTAHGSLTVSENGAFEYRPDSTFTGVDRLVFRVSDGPSSSPPQTIEFNVSNRNPVARDDRFTIMHDRLAAGASYDVLTNDADPDEDPVTVSLLQGVGSAGDLHLDSTGKFTFSPSLHFVGAASFRYRISDGVSFDDADVTINFTNDAPVLSPDRYVVEANHSLSVAAIHGVCSNDRDPDEDPFTVQLVEGALHGAVTLSGDGSIVYVPTPDFVGIDEFSYRAMDGVVSAANAPVTRVRIHVVAQSQFAENDEYTTSHGRALVANVLDNDLVATGIPWSISLVQAPAFGIFELGAEGEFHYLPSADFSGDVTARYAIQQGGSTVFADMLFHVENSAPRGTRADYTILHGTRLMTTHATGLLALASDAEEDILSVSILSGPRYGDLHLNPDGSFDYFPRSSEFVGQDSFQYSLSDGVTTSVAQTATIHVIDSPPKSTPDRLSVHAGQLLSVAATGGVLANDYDTDLDSLVALVVDNPTHGALTLDRDGAFRYLPNPGFVGVDHWSYRVFDGALSTEPTSVDIRVENTGPLTENDDYSVLHGVTLCVGSSEGVISNDSDPDHDVLWASLVTSVPTGALDFQSDGAFTFYPPPGFAGVTTFTYKTTDGLTWSDPVTAVIHVTNMGPIARDDFRGTTVNHSAMISVVELLKNDSDGDHDPLTFTLSTAPSHGTVEVMPDGLAKYTPNPQFAGDDSFTYQITDGIVVSNRATVKITVRNSTPTANDDQFSIPHDQSLAVTAGRILQNDNDSDQTSLIAKIVANPNHGTLSFAQTGEFLYTPFPGYVGADSFLYQLSDGILNSPPAKVAITVENHSPKSPGQSYKVRHDQILTVSSTVGVLSKARDADSDPLRVELLASSNHGSLFIDTNGGFRYVPEAAFVGKDSFVYRVFDGIDYSSPISTLIEVE